MKSKTATVLVFVLCLVAGGLFGLAGARAQTPKPELNGWTGCGVESCHARENTILHNGIHAARGVTCDGCHGGNPAVRADEVDAINRAMWNSGMDFLSPDPKTEAGQNATQKLLIAQMCAKCHSWQHGKTSNPFEEYKTSTHGRKLFMEKDARVAVCTDCHGAAHRITAANDAASSTHPTNVPMTCGQSGCHDGDHGARSKTVAADKKAYPPGTLESCMKCHEPADLVSVRADQPGQTEPKPLPATRFHEYAASVHGNAVIGRGDTASPTCASCHSAHAAYPPEFSDVTRVCGKCHINEPQQLRLSPHMEAMTHRKLSFCVTCHGGGSHAIPPADESMLETTCSNKTCHGEDVTKQEMLGLTLHDLMHTARKRVEAAEVQIEQVRKHGAETDLMDDNLAKAKASLTEAKPVLHSLRTSEVERFVEQANFFCDVIDHEIEAIHETQEDRKLLFWPFMGFILVTIVLIYWKVHLLEAAHTKANHATD